MVRKTLTEIVETAPEFHGDDKAAAITRAKKIGGRCIYSLAKGSQLGSPDAKWGYWSEGDDNGFIRNWEQEIPLRETKVGRRA